ncbi:MAG: hypothetical protein GX790_09475, partial [Syntrophomonadaceae bacterium]|nr:hypothetical protein [Syntrophomonadaceae bacterium]
MKIKKIIAKDYRVAIKKAKEEMGQDAIILQTRQIKSPGILGFFSRPKVEVTVAVDDTLQVNMDRIRKSSINSNSLVSVQDIKPKYEEMDNSLFEELNSLKNMMADIKTHMFEMDFIKGISKDVQKFYRLLVENNVNKDIALQIVTSVEKKLPKNGHTDESWTRDVLLHTLQQYIKEIKPIEIKSDKKATVVFFVGPTGVGKTTTIAKLAANIAFVVNKDVALITLD